MTESFDNWFAREFYGEDFFKSLQQNYDDARVYLKNCGKPHDDADRMLIQINKETARWAKALMNPHKELELMRARQ